MRAVFLDIDGVLNDGCSNAYFEIEKVQLLNRILTVTDARLVVTSTWRFGLTAEEMEEILSSQGVLPGRVIGVTPFLDKERGEEIVEWLRSFAQTFGIREIVILDDRCDMEPLSDYLVQTSRSEGITEPDAELAIEYLTSAPYLNLTGDEESGTGFFGSRS